MSVRQASFLAIAVMCFSFANAVRAQTNYTISVDVDEATGSDIQLIEDSLGGATEGTQVPRTLRGIVMSALGEVLSQANARVDEFDMLTLDDGTRVPLLDEDTFIIEAKLPLKKFGPVFACKKKKVIVSGRGGCQPECVRLPNGNFVTIPANAISKSCGGIIIIPK